MAEPEVATKAPESDAMEETKTESLIPGDTPVAQASSSLGVSCFRDDLVLLC